MTEAATIAELLDEANHLAAKREGVHDMAQACAIVRGYASLSSTGEAVPVERIAEIVGNMRACVRTGFFPKERTSMFAAVSVLSVRLERGELVTAPPG